MILTATRRGETLGARWEEIDLDQRMWTITAGRMKAGREHRVALSTRAVAILKEMVDAKAERIRLPRCEARALTFAGHAREGAHALERGSDVARLSELVS